MDVNDVGDFLLMRQKKSVGLEERYLGDTKCLLDHDECPFVWIKMIFLYCRCDGERDVHWRAGLGAGLRPCVCFDNK